jgi:hypothetical protein
LVIAESFEAVKEYKNAKTPRGFLGRLHVVIILFSFDDSTFKPQCFSIGRKSLS